MRLAAVMDAVADRLKTIDGLRAHAYPQTDVEPPAAIVTYEGTWTYDETFRRGMDRAELGVVVMVGMADERSARDRLSVYLDGAGDQSVKTTLEAEGYDTDVLHTVRVTEADIDVYTSAGVPYLTAIFTIDITGPGGS